jgi:amidase
MQHLSRRAMLAGSAASLSLAACTPNPLSTADSPRAPAPGPAGGAEAVPFRDGMAIAAAIAAGETTALAEVEAAIRRAKAVEGDINGIVTETFETARADAGGVLSGPFAGVPSFIKDLYDWRGAPTLWGSRAFAGHVAPEDSPFAAAWRRAGIVSLGKSATPEAGLISSTEPLSNGPTRNPWDLARIPGGSSGGAAALVAAGVVPFAHATDGGGSIRIPASCCGVFGLKPSRQRLHYGREAAPVVDISVAHAVTISVRDSIELFRIAERPESPYPRLGRVEPLSRRLRIGFAPDPIGGTALHSDTRTAMEGVAQLCEELGHTVIDYRMDLDGERFTDAFVLYWAAGAAQFAEAASAFAGRPPSPEILEPWTLGLAALSQQRAADIPAAIATLLEADARYNDSFFETVDVILTPVVASPPVPIGEQRPDGDFETVMQSVTGFVAYTTPMNAAGAPSMSVPLAWSPGGLPIGAMFSAKRGEDGLLFELALELEAARPWAGRRPAVYSL